MSDLIWSVIRKSNAFKVGSRHDTAYFSTERGNITGNHSIRASGLTHAVAVDIQPLPGAPKKGAYGVAVRVRTSDHGKDVKPAKQWTTYHTKGADHAQRIRVKKIVRALGRDRTVAKLAQLRLSKVLRSTYRKKLARATGRAQKRHLAKEKKEKKSKK